MSGVLGFLYGVFGREDEVGVVGCFADAEDDKRRPGVVGRDLGEAPAPAATAEPAPLPPTLRLAELCMGTSREM